MPMSFSFLIVLIPGRFADDLSGMALLALTPMATHCLQVNESEVLAA